MPMHVFIAFMIAATLLSTAEALPSASATQPASAQPKNLRAESLIAEVEQNGAPGVVRRLWADQDEWDLVVRAVARGSQSWLDVAALLRTATDAGASEMLDIALADALEARPERVLAMLNTSFDIESVCFLSVEPYKTSAEALRALERRTRRVGAVTRVDLQATRDQCVRKLKAERSEIEGIYTKNPHE
jgi:hypothetical protein